MACARVLGSFLTLAAFSLACGRTEPFGTESYTPYAHPPDAADGGEPADIRPGDPDLGPSDLGTPDFGPAPDGRPNFPDVGFPDLPCDGCDDIRRTLEMIRWESPCRGGDGPERCRTDGPITAAFNLRGLPGSQYEVVLRFRGVVERRTYVGGYHEGGAWQIGGGPTANARNIFQLELTSPAQSIYLNRTDDQEEFCEIIDERLAIRFNVGTSILANIQGRGAQLRNRGADGRPLVVAGVPPAPQPYNGQFIQLSVESIRRIR